MKAAHVTDRVWHALLALRDGAAPLAPRNWTPPEVAAWELYAPLARRTGRPMRLAQIGQSLDGRVATPSGDARDVSGPDGLAHLHRVRALVDGVVIGVRTALHDSARLTVRLVEGPNPARVIIDPAGRLPDDAPCLARDGARRVVVQAVDRPRPPGVEVLHLPARGGWMAPDAIARALSGAGLSHVLIEGGGTTIAGFLEGGLLARLHVAIAPLIIGAGPSGLTTSPVARLADAIRPETHVYGLGSDILFDCDLTRPAATAAVPSAAAQRV
ncbi:RibD family protein [Rhodobaculum claviforme]|uniref:Riboflavin deaminase n=1 Tax=Rhodobaculum claviforme TaxID=1549854 RepID=A0A934TPR5_9RHOB|nr:RibD family protein [Rhodobaculum claviforme]MBK5928893.1 riboflavin deaminase [Rhodobaculum claviforme]